MRLNQLVSCTLTIVAISLFSTGAFGASVASVTVFARGTDVAASAPDSITLGEDSIWVSYANNADSTGLSGSSTIVQYTFSGTVLRTITIAGSVDGLKVEPGTGLVWALQNQDGNSKLTKINPIDGTTASFSYDVQSSTRGYDDVVFRGSRTFMSYTNPTEPGDPTIQMLVTGSDPLAFTTVLTKGARGTNLATGERNQRTAQSDPDSLRLTPSGDLQLSSGDDGQLIFVRQPGTQDQAVSFLTLLNPQTLQPVSGLDDALFATAPHGVFYLTDTGNNRVLAITVDGLNGDLLASVGSTVQALVTVDTKTGVVTPLVTNLKGPHGLVFVPQNIGDK